MAWDQITAMIREAQDIVDQDRSTPPTSCVSCYTSLKQGPTGTLFCPYDGLKWPEDASAWGEFPGSY